MTRSILKRLLLASLIVWPAMAAPVTVTGYDRQLIPVTVFRASAAYGTLWNTRAWAVYEGESLVIVGDVFVGLPTIYGRSQPIPLAPLVSLNEPPGSVVYVRKEAVRLTHISARVERLDPVTRQTIDETPIPVVPESQFVAQTLYFSGLKNNPTAERIHLRVYSLDLEHFDPRVRVRVQSALPGGLPPDASWSLRYDEFYRLTAEQKYVEYEGQVFPRRPLALELSLDPILRNIPAGSDIAISVVPVANDFRLWAMVSETNNVTQRVRLQLPQ